MAVRTLQLHIYKNIEITNFRKDPFYFINYVLLISFDRASEALSGSVFNYLL